jgi:hypothetical protein
MSGAIFWGILQFAVCNDVASDFSKGDSSRRSTAPGRHEASVDLVHNIVALKGGALHDVVLLVPRGV